MAHDVSRSAYDARVSKHWSGVQAQQGRLLSDDDWNEAQAIDADDTRRTRAQVIGAAGSPDNGFKVAAPRITANKIDFDLLPGTMYVGGHRVTLDQTEAFTLQRDWLQQPPSERPDTGGAERIDAVYLEVWQQPVTAVEDTELTEVALGGPDTSVRLRTMRRVRVLPNVGTESCSAAWAAVRARLGPLSEDNELTSGATLRVGFVPNAGSGDNLCSPSAQNGYLGAENQAIRVEVGAGGNKLLWSYDNASPLYRVRVSTQAGVQTVRFLQPPKDEAHWPLAQQTVELLPWSAVLPNGEKVAETHGGFLAKVAASYDPDARTITTTPPVPAAFGATWQSRSDATTLSTVQDSFFYLRVWNRGGDTASVSEIPFTAGTPVPLTGTGLTVTLSGGPLRPGDFWIIAARPESPARVVPWRLEAGLPAEGPRRFYAPLGIVHWRPGGGHTTVDCRDTFVPLTKDRGCCITVSPAINWQHRLDSIAGANDVCVCFQPGDYETDRTIEFRNKHVRLHGDGGGSRITGRGVETVIRFVDCTSVDVSDLSVRADTPAPSQGPGARPNLGGAITTRNCERVSVTRVTARCASGPVTAAAAISLHTTFGGEQAVRSTARVNGCDLVAGANQVGLQVVNYGRTTLIDNTVRVDAAENGKFAVHWLQDEQFLRRFRRTLLYNYGLLGEDTGGQQPKPGWSPISVGGVKVWIVTHPNLRDPWQTVANWRRLPGRRRDYLAMGDFLNDMAESLLRGIGVVGVHTSPAFRTFIVQLFAGATAATGVRMVAARGIVVGGTVAHDVRISGNTVRDVVQGIHVGVSARRKRNPGRDAPVSDTAGRVVISHNVVHIALMPESVTERHGVFVGNSTSLLIDGNLVTCEKIGTAGRLHIEGIRVYGFYGPSALIARNHLSGFSVGIRTAAINNATAGQSSLWRVSDNIAVGSSMSVDRRLRDGEATFVDPAGNKP
ncbi:DUF6519 domain-containing protein [Actinoplanes sp. NEAU-A12]|uniref:DUF6519 domain-containing protein n=1 Tax=Actinoplanes sandaracinus TaxID=3045177 RepID=A0ABT6WWM7_9ACTN|nr:DUF6519 domain-containing protein [Actinoplanes sandaracinus]MDI6104129.1 DUF6519 domain-containing protein [Actinoplanes sandaracinus]